MTPPPGPRTALNYYARWINHDPDCMGRFGGNEPRNHCTCGLRDAIEAEAASAETAAWLSETGEAAAAALPDVEELAAALAHCLGYLQTESPTVEGSYWTDRATAILAEIERGQE